MIKQIYPKAMVWLLLLAGWLVLGTGCSEKEDKTAHQEAIDSLCSEKEDKTTHQESVDSLITAITEAQKRGKADTAVLASDERRISGKGYHGCVRKAEFDTLVLGKGQKDPRARARALMSAIITRSCATFKEGIIVVVKDSVSSPEAIKVNVRGGWTGYWIKREAVK